MRIYLWIYAALTTAALWWSLNHYRAEKQRFEQNLEALFATCETYRDKASRAVAEVQVLRLKKREFEKMRHEDAERIRSMGVRLRRLEAAATTSLETRVEGRASLRDTMIIHVRDTVRIVDTLRMFRWRDSWVEVEGAICRDSVECCITSVDTLRQIVHRIPRRFLFFRWGTKALRQSVTSTNPHTRIVATEYIRVER